MLDIESIRDHVTLFEPRAGVPLSGQPVLRELIAPSGRRLRSPVWWLATVVGVVGLCLPGHPAGLAGPVIVAVVGLLPLVVAGLSVRRSMGFVALSASPMRQVTLAEGDLRCAGRVVSLRLADEEKWAVARMSPGDMLTLARVRRVWVFGPSGGGIGLFVPGGDRLRVARLVEEPPAGSEPVVAALASWPPAPRDDPAVRLALRSRLFTGLIMLALVVVALGWVVFDTLVVDRSGTLALVTDVVWLVFAAFLALLLVVAVPDIGRGLLARRAMKWTMLSVTADGAPTVRGTGMRVAVRAAMPHSREIRLTVSGSPALVVPVYESGQLWLLGESHQKRKMLAGIPEVPTVGDVRRVEH